MTINSTEIIQDIRTDFEQMLDYVMGEEARTASADQIEGACRHLVKDRCELSGMRWHQRGVENLLRLRAVAENDDWDAYHAFRRHQRHLRLYSSSIPNTQPIEIQVIHSPSPSHDPIPSTHPPNYHQLPLAA